MSNMADVDWSIVPSGYPPPGIVPNLVDPYSERNSIWITAGICTFFVIVMVVARLATKQWIVKKLHFEDYLLAASGISYIIGIPFFCLQGWQGAGTHQWNVSVAQSLELLRLANICEAMYCLNVVFAKLAILVQMKRVLALSKKSIIYWLMIILIWVVLAFYTAAFFMVIWSCVPREKIWQPWLSGVCMDEVLGDMIAGAFNLGTDVFMLILPIFAIFRLKIALQQRLLVCAVFSTGMLACIFSALRVYFGMILLDTTDRTYALTAASCVSMGESTSLTIIVCFPTIRLMFLHLSGKSPIQQDRSESMQQLRDKVISPVSRTNSRLSGGISPISPISPTSPCRAYGGGKW